MCRISWRLDMNQWFYDTWSVGHTRKSRKIWFCGNSPAAEHKRWFGGMYNVLLLNMLHWHVWMPKPPGDILSPLGKIFYSRFSKWRLSKKSISRNIPIIAIKCNKTLIYLSQHLSQPQQKHNKTVWSLCGAILSI